MSDDWKPGDLALCVLGGFIAGPGGLGEYPVAGRIYTVERFLPSRYFADGATRSALQIQDGPPNRGNDRVWSSHRFRKINPLNEAERAAAMRDLRVPELASEGVRHNV